MSAQPNPSISTRPPINALAQYLMALAAVIGCYSLYLKFAVPVIEGPPHEFKRRDITPLPELSFAAVDKSQLIPLLPDEAWELSGCKKLLTSSGLLLFKKIEQLDDGTLQVFPFTLISGLDQKPHSDPQKQADPPMVLRCPEGANVKFDKPMRDVFNGGTKIESAQLTGQVRIFRAPSAPDKNDPLEILTSNIQIDRKRIFTLEDVDFRFGSNQGSGRNLLIDLAHDTDGSEAIKDFSNIKGVRRLELAFLHRLRIEPSSLEKPKTVKTDVNSELSKGKLFSNNKTPLEITCNGPFVFEFESMTASFVDQVVAQQVDSFQDNIKCDKLLLTFEGDIESDPIRDASGADAANQEPDSKFKLKNFVAIGKPAVVTSRSRSAKVSAEYLRFDVLTSRIEARGNPNGDELVTLVSPEYQMVTRELTYIVPEDNSLGPIQANGPGRLLRVSKGDQDEFFATWTKSLVSRSDPNQARLQHVILDGETRIRIADKTRVAADRVELLVWKTPKPTSMPDGSIKQSWEYLPTKVITTGNVSIVSEKLEGTANQLTAVWPQPTSPVLGYRSQFPPEFHLRRVGYRGSLKQQSSGSPAPAQTYTRGNFQKIAPNNQAGNNRSERQVAAAPGPVKKTIFHGREVQVQLVRNGKKSELRDLIVIGDVSITQAPILAPAKPGDSKPVPIKINGERMRLIPQGNENYRALVSGSTTRLARISAPDLELEGENINLDQSANKLWIEGAGSMQHRSSKSKKAANQNPQAPAVKQSLSPEQLDVSWEGGMIFDGAKIYFEKNVQMATEQIAKNNRRSAITASSQGLSVELKNRVSFQDLSDGKKIDNFEVRELVLVDHVSPDKLVFQLAGHAKGADPSSAKRTVVVQNQTFDPAGKLVEQQRFSAPHATIDAISGSMKAKGPGTIATHRLGKNDSKDSADPFRQLARTDGTAGISFIQINFDNEMNVDSKKRQMIVTGNIRTIYSPVPDWQMTVNPDDVRGRLAGSVHLTCERLQMAQWSSRNNVKPTNEMIATGNAHILNDRFDATADRVSYDQSTDMLVVEGTPRSDANLWFKQTANDKEPTHVVAEKIRFRIKDQWTDVQGVKSAVGMRK